MATGAAHLSDFSPSTSSSRFQYTVHRFSPKSGCRECRCVPVILDAGGMDAPISQEVLNFVDILSPNETELGRLTGMPTETFEQMSNAVVKCHKMGVKQVLVKLGDKGSALFVESKEPLKQPFISAAKVLDATGAGDTFTASFAVARGWQVQKGMLEICSCGGFSLCSSKGSHS